MCIRPFDRVTVKLAVDDTRVHPRLAMELIDEATGKPLVEMLISQARSGVADEAATQPADAPPLGGRAAAAA